MRRMAAALSVCALLFQTAALADSGGDPVSWLGRIASAGQQLNYSGTFIYQSGGNLETSRITRLVDASGERERLEVLDGSPREVIRNNAEVRCVLPDQRLVIMDRSGTARSFPSRLPGSYASVGEHYSVRAGEPARVAGLDTQLIILEPRDDLRYGHMLWADLASGLLVKARMVGPEGELIEQFAFTDVRIGGEIAAEALQPRFEGGQDWRVIDVQGEVVREEDSDWVLASPLPGYLLKSIVRRPLGNERGEILHMVYGDGLAAISVFVEPVGADHPSPPAEALHSGAINIYKRLVSGHLVTALGEAPARAVRMLGDGIEPVRQ